MSILADNFNDNSRDTVKWSLGSIAFQNAGVSVSETNQELEITPIANEPAAAIYGYQSVATFNLTGLEAKIRLAADFGSPSEAWMVLALDAGNYLRIHAVGGGDIFTRSRVATVNANQDHGAFSFSTHTHWKIRHDKLTDEIVWETSSDGSAWTELRRLARPFEITAITIYLSGGSAASSATPPVVKFDDFALQVVSGPALFRGRSFSFFDDEEVNRFEFWPAVSAGAAVHERAVSVEGAGTITTAGQCDLIRSTSIIASANISATGNFFSVLEASTSINASAAIDISGVGFSTLERAALLTASPVIEISGTRVVDRSVSIDTAAGIATNAQFLSVFESSASISVVASITVAGHGVLERAAGITNSSDISVSAQSFSVIISSASLNGTATITVAHRRELFRSASLQALAAITVRGEGAAEEVERSVSISLTAGVAVSGHAIIERSVSLVSSASISVSAISFSAVERSIAFNAAGTIHVSGFSIRARSVQIASTADIAVSGQFYSTLERSVSFESTASIAVSGISFSFTEYERSIAISATGTINVLGYPAVIILHPTNVNLLNSGQLSAVITNGTNSVSINSGETEAILNG